MFFYWRKRKKGQEAEENKPRRKPRNFLPMVEILEDRIHLAWNPLGLAPQTGWPTSNSIFADAVADLQEKWAIPGIQLDKR